MTGLGWGGEPGPTVMKIRGVSTVSPEVTGKGG